MHQKFTLLLAIYSKIGKVVNIRYLQAFSDVSAPYIANLHADRTKTP